MYGITFTFRVQFCLQGGWTWNPIKGCLPQLCQFLDLWKKSLEIGEPAKWLTLESFNLLATLHLALRRWLAISFLPLKRNFVSGYWFLRAVMVWLCYMQDKSMFAPAWTCFEMEFWRLATSVTLFEFVWKFGFQFNPFSAQNVAANFPVHLWGNYKAECVWFWNLQPGICSPVCCLCRHYHNLSAPHHR